MLLSLLPRILISVFSIFLSINFIFFSFQHYIPPSFRHSVSYSILNCPSHSNRNSISYIIYYLYGSEGKEGNEKNCPCFTCSIHRFSFIASKPSINFLIDEYRAYLFALDQNLPLKEFYKNLSIRSPPMLSS